MIGNNAAGDPGTVDETRRAGGRLAGPPLPPGVDVERRGDQLRGVRPPGHRCLGVPLRRGRHGDPAPAHRALAGHLARRAARGAGRRRATATASTARGTRSPGCGSTPHKLLLDPYARAVSRRGRRNDPAVFGYVVGSPEQPSDARLRAVRPAQRGRRRRLRLGRRPPAAPPLARHGDLRVHVKGLTALHDRVPEELRGTYAGLASRRGHRLPARPRRHRRRAAARPPVRLRAGRGRARAHQLLGLQLDRLLRPARRLLVVRRPRPAGHRVQADGQGAARGRASRCSSTSSTTTPPRAARSGRRCRFRGLDDRGFYQRVPHGAGGDAGLDDTYWDVTGCGNTVDAAEPAGAAADPRLAALLGHRDARRRLPLRPALGADPHRPRRRHARRAADHDRPGPGAAAREADRRAVGRLDGRLPGRRVPAAVGGVERPVPRHDPRLLARRVRAASATVATRLAGSSDLYADDGRSPYASVNFVTAHDGFTAARPGRPTTASTTRPTARTTATAPTTTGPGTTASRARPTTRRSSRCAAGRPRT